MGKTSVGDNRWRIALIDRDGRIGATFVAVSVAQRCLLVLALRAAGATFLVEGFAA